MKKLKILTFNWHEGYIHLLSKTGYEFDVIQVSKGGIYGWIHEFRPLPSNCNLIREEDAISRHNAGHYDRIICHNINDLLFAYESPINKVLIFHNKLSCEIALSSNTINKEEYLRQVHQLLDKAKNRTLVFISKAKRDDCGLDGEIILPGIDISEYGGYRGSIKKVLRVGNGLKARDIMLGWTVQDRLLNGINSTIVGLNPDIHGSRIPGDWEELKGFMRSHRVYLNTTLHPYEDGYNLAMLEAMAVGMPVVSMANPTSPLEDGINGFISDDKDYLRERIIELLRDHFLAKSIGQRAQETVRERFPIDKFIGEWKRVLEGSAGLQRYSINFKCKICKSKVGLFHEDNRKFYRCPNCLLIFTAHTLEKEDCEKHYKAQWETVDANHWKNQVDAILSIVQRYIMPRRILDFGAGSGGLTKELISRGIDATAFEPMLHGDFKAQKFNDKFDVVVALEVIEHIDGIYQVFKDIEKVLSEDGVIFFTTCLTDKFINELNAVDHFRHWWYKDDLTHVNYFCRTAVTKLAEALKFNVDFYGDNVFVLSRSGKRKRQRTFTKDIDDYYRQKRSDIEALIPNGAMKVLDIGCADGTLGKRLLEKGIREVIGIEINPNACKNAEHNLSRIICGDIEEIVLPFKEGYFDCIICGDALEHLKEPLSVLKKIKSYLSNAGAIIASIPNVRHHGVINMLANGRWKYEDYGILDRTHLRFFTKKEIEELFYDAGFEITGITENIDPQYYNINPLSENISFGRVTLNNLTPNELKDLFVVQYLIRAQKARYALNRESVNFENQGLENQKAELEEYLNTHPADLNMLYKYAEVCYKLGFKAEALESLEKILIFEPERKDAVDMRKEITERLDADKHI